MLSVLSPITVFNEAFRRVRENPAGFLPWALLLVVNEILYYWGYLAFGPLHEYSTPLTFAAIFIGYPVAFFAVMNRTLAAGSAEPISLLFRGRFWKFLFALAALTAIGKMIFVILFLTSSEILTAFEDGHFVVFGQTFFMAMACYGVMARLSLVLPPISIGKNYDYYASWQMARGYLYSILSTFIPYAVAGIAMASVSQPLDGSAISRPLLFACCVLTGGVGFFTLAAYTVWYEKLAELRDEAQHEENAGRAA